MMSLIVFQLVALFLFNISICAAGSASGICVYTATECSCSQASSSLEPMCVRLQSATSADEGICAVEPCAKGGWKCDCLHGDHICSRRACSQWVSQASQMFPRPARFSCSRKIGDCIEPKTIVQGAPSTSAAPTTKANTPGPKAAPATAAPSSTKTKVVKARPTTTVKATTTTTTKKTVAKSTVATKTTSSVVEKKKCDASMCPSCYIPSEYCDSCVADTSISFPERCDMCSGVGSDACPQGLQCCPNTSACKGKTLVARGLPIHTITFICSENCAASCDSSKASTCVKFSPTGLLLSRTDSRHISSIPICR
jgi:hypothetical protein